MIKSFFFINFLSFAEIFSLIPTKIGIIIRKVWYRYALAKCGEHVTISHLSAIRDPNSEIGSWVSCGRNCWLGQCRIGSHVVMANNITIIPGMRQHGMMRNKLMLEQPHDEPRITTIGDDVWIGSNAVIGADVARGTVVGAGAIVTKTFPEYSVIAGVPAKIIGERK